VLDVLAQPKIQCVIHTFRSGMHVRFFRSVMSLVTTPDGTVLDVDEAVCDFLVRDRDILLGANFCGMLTPLYRVGACFSFRVA
jgi:hypothetical protein